MQCPSCNQHDTILVDSIKSSDLIVLYKKKMDIDISSLLQKDIINYLYCNQCGLYFFQALITGTEEFYETLQQFDWYYLNEKNEYHYAKKFVKLNDHILEIGCGSGNFTNFISPRIYVGLEFNKEAIKQAKKCGVNVLEQTIEAHADQFPDSYDVVCSFQVLEHVAEIYSFIGSALKCLKSGGYLIIAVPNHDSFLRYCYNNILNLPPHHVSHWDKKALINLKKIHDLDLIDFFEESLDNIHDRWFLHTFFYKILTDRFNYRVHLIDNSFKATLLSKLASLLARFIKHPLPREILPAGHSICVVYRKK